MLSDASFIPTYIGYVKPNAKPQASVGTNLSCAKELLIKSNIPDSERIVKILFIGLPSLVIENIILLTN